MLLVAIKNQKVAIQTDQENWCSNCWPNKAIQTDTKNSIKGRNWTQKHNNIKHWQHNTIQFNSTPIFQGPTDCWQAETVAYLKMVYSFLTPAITFAAVAFFLGNLGDGLNIFQVRVACSHICHLFYETNILNIKNLKLIFVLHTGYNFNKRVH